MTIPALRRYWLFGCLCVMMVASGCFQAVGSDTTPIAQALPSDTPLPSPTDLPTDPPTDTPTPDDAEDTSELDFPTVPAVATATATSEPIQVAQQPTIDEFALSATAFLLQRTQEFEATQTQAAINAGQLPVATPTIFGEVPLGPATATVPVQQQLPGTDCVHEVRPAEPNLFRISLLYGVSVNDIAARNGIANINLIHFGDQLIIPGCGTTGVVPLPTSTAAAISAQDAGATGGSTGGTVGTGTVTGGQIHVVQQYESLFEISLRYGVSVNDIAARNGITNVNLIYMGQELVIP